MIDFEHSALVISFFFFHCVTAYEDSFLLEDYTVTNTVFTKTHTTRLSWRALHVVTIYNWDYRWIWTNFEQLLNWQTLECMTDDYYQYYVPGNDKYFVTMKKCDRNNQKQLWECVGDRIEQTWSGRYMWPTTENKTDT